MGELQEYRRQIAQINAEVAELVQDLTERQFHWRPAPGRWSLGENLSHLAVSEGVAGPLVDSLIARGLAAGTGTGTRPAGAGRGPGRPSLTGEWVIRWMEPPVRLKVRTLKPYLPPPDRSMAEVLEAFAATQDRLLQRVERSAGLDLARLRAPLNWLPVVPLSLGQWFRYIAAHERRHVWQMRNVCRAPGFPRT